MYAKYVSAFSQIKFHLIRLYPQFRGNAEKSAFFVFLVRALRRMTTSGKYLVHFQGNCLGFQLKPSELFSDVSLPIVFMSELKSFGVAPTSPTVIFKVIFD